MTLDNQPICCHGSLLSQLKSFRCKALTPSFNTQLPHLPSFCELVSGVFSQKRIKNHHDFSSSAELYGIVLTCCCFAPRSPSFPKQRLLDQLSLPWKNVTNISRTMGQWGGREWMVVDGAGARQEFARGPKPPSSPLLQKYCHCPWKLYTHRTMIGLIRNHPVPEVIGPRPFQLLSIISTFLPRETNVLTKCAAEL